MACTNPFQLSGSDAEQFANDLGQYFDALPPWGGMFAWHGRLVLVTEKIDGTMVYSDVSGGIPWSKAQGGCIPAQAFLLAMGRGEYISPTEAFFMSLPQNFMDIAKQRYDQVIAAGQQLADDILDPAAKKVTDILWPLAIVAAVVLAVVYLPKKG